MIKTGRGSGQTGKIKLLKLCTSSSLLPMRQVSLACLLGQFKWLHTVQGKMTVFLFPSTRRYSFCWWKQRRIPLGSLIWHQLFEAIQNMSYLRMVHPTLCAGFARNAVTFQHIPSGARNSSHMTSLSRFSKGNEPPTFCCRSLKFIFSGWICWRQKQCFLMIQDSDLNAGRWEDSLHFTSPANFHIPAAPDRCPDRFLESFLMLLHTQYFMLGLSCNHNALKELIWRSVTAKWSAC